MNQKHPPPPVHQPAPLFSTPCELAAEQAAIPTKEMLQFIQDEGDYITNLNNEKQNQLILNRLKVMLPLAYLSPALKASIKCLLAVNEFTGNMGYMEIFTPLQEFCQEVLFQLGAPLQKLYANSQRIQSIGKMKIPTSLSTAGSLLRQDHPLVGLFAGTLDLSDFNGESIYIHFLRILALLLNNAFHDKVINIVTPLGGEHKGCAIKGDARMRNKALSAEDHRYEQKPRPAHNIDIIRCCVTCENAASLTKVIAALAEGFSSSKSSVGRIKNGFALSDAQAAQSFHYRSYMMNLICDFGMTFSELLSKSESMTVVENYVNAPPTNPRENWPRWRRHAMAAADELKSVARANLPVLMVCEVQVILRPYLDARKQMHLLYKVVRADSPEHLAQQFAVAESNTNTQAATWEVERKRKAEVTRQEMAQSAQTVLNEACFYGYVESVRMALLETDQVNVNEANSNGATGLCLAVENGHSDVVKLLLATKGIDVNQTDSDGLDALSIASEKGDVDIITLLLGSEGIDVNYARDNNGATALLMASQAGFSDVVKLLLAAEGIDVNQQEEVGMTALMMASQEGHSNVVKLLLEAKDIDVNQTTYDEMLLVGMDETQATSTQATSSITSSSTGATALSIASSQGYAEIVILLLAKEGIDVNISMSDGQSALFLAAYGGHEIIISLLLAESSLTIACLNMQVVDPSPIDSTCSGLTPLGAALKNDHDQVVNLLTGAGAQ